MGLIKEALEAIIRIDRNLAAIRKVLVKDSDDSLYRATYLQKPIESRGSTYNRIQTEKDFYYPDHLTFGGRLRAVRMFYGLTQIEIGNSIGVTCGHISNLEKDVSTPSAMLIRAASLKWNIDEHWLATGERTPVDHVDQASETIKQCFQRIMEEFNPESPTKVAFSNCDLRRPPDGER